MANKSSKRAIRIIASFVIYVACWPLFFWFVDMARQSDFGVIKWVNTDGTIGGIEATATVVVAIAIVSLIVFIISLLQERKDGVFRRSRLK